MTKYSIAKTKKKTFQSHGVILTFSTLEESFGSLFLTSSNNTYCYSLKVDSLLHFKINFCANFIFEKRMHVPLLKKNLRSLKKLSAPFINAKGWFLNARVDKHKGC